MQVDAYTSASTHMVTCAEGPWCGTKKDVWTHTEHTQVTVWETEDWGEVMFLTLHVILANLSHNFVAQFDYLYLNLFSFISEILWNLEYPSELFLMGSPEKLEKFFLKILIYEISSATQVPLG